MAALNRVSSLARPAFSRRLRLWASRRARWGVRPLAMAAAMLATGVSHTVWAAPDVFALPKEINGTLSLRGKKFNFQPGSQGSVLGAQVDVLDSKGVKIGVTRKLTQRVKRGLYNWESFNIGSQATFEFDMTAGVGSAALNRVVNDLNPSEIFGRLNANGDVFLINRNGILFGAGAQVNVGGLVASTLEMSDSVFLGEVNTVDTAEATYAWADEPGLSTYDHPSNYVRVDPGATITTASGGNVLLMARKVENAGTIHTQSGQAALVAGSRVFVKGPTSEAIYASEVNPGVPALRGLLFEVDGLTGEASNLGQILSERGNTTLMAYTVRQGGHIQATTTVQENGSVFLLARSQVEPGESVRATQGGQLVLGQGSRIEISPDDSQLGSGSVTMTASRIELNGKTIDMGEDSVIKAPGAIVNARAEASPSYVPLSSAQAQAEPSQARFVMRQGASIDVSGTTDQTASVDRFFVTTELIRSSDLASNPMFKDGALKDTKVTYDTRQAPAVIEAGSHTAYKNGIQTNASERMVHGGQVNLASTGAVLLQEGSTVDVSGGKMSYTEALVSPTLLKGADGKTYTLNTARTDVQIVAVSGGQPTDATRFGNVSPNEAALSRREAGYVEGGHGGTFAVQAPKVVLDGALKANILQGERQKLGLDTRARMASVKLGVASTGNLLGGVHIKAQTSAQAALWKDPFAAELPVSNEVSASWFHNSGAGHLSVLTDGGLTVADGATLRLQKGGSLSMTAQGPQGMVLGGDITGSGAQVSLSTLAPQDPQLDAGGIVLKAGRQIDVSGDVVNQKLDGAQAGNALAGGQVSIKSAAGLDLQEGSAVRVSGGATVSTTGVVTGTRAGVITLEANNAASSRGAVPDTLAHQFSPVTLGATLEGYTLAGNVVKAYNDAGDSLTGKLSIKVGEVDIVAAGAGVPLVSRGAQADAFKLSTDFFNQGGFSQFDVNGVRRLSVNTLARLAPQAKRWLAGTGLARAASGASLSQHVSQVALPEWQRPTVSLALRATGSYDNISSKAYGNGLLEIAAGSEVQAGTLGQVKLEGGTQVKIDGAVRAAGGSISADLVGIDTNTEVDQRFKGVYALGDKAVLDVSGTARYNQQPTAKSQEGRLLDGGQITLSMSSSGRANTGLEIRHGAQLLANGSAQELDVREMDANGISRLVRRDVVSNGGSISVQASSGGALLAGSLQAKAGGAGGNGGALKVSLLDANSAATPTVAVLVQQAALTATDTLERGQAVVSADAVKAGGFANLSIQSGDRIETVGDVSLRVQGKLVLDAPTLAAREASKALLSAGSRLVRTNSLNPAVNLDGTRGGDGVVTLQADVLDVMGRHNTQGIGSLHLMGQSELRFNPLGSGNNVGELLTDANLFLTAPQITVSTAADYTVDAGDRLIRIDGGEPGVAAPLSAGGRFTLKAGEIDHQGVIRVPLGQVFMQADKITLQRGSEVSVSGSGLTVPYGTTSEGGTQWLLNDIPLGAPLEKTITLDATAGEVNLAPGATLNLSAGGQMVGWEFIAGPGGSKDVFVGSFESGSFAVVPSVRGVAPLDAELLIKAGVSDLAGASLTREITFGEGGPVPAGTYTVLPARYALLQGAFLVKSSTAAPLALGDSQILGTGATRVGAVVGTRGGSLAAAPSATFEVLTREQALRYSEIKATSFDDLLAAQADRLGVSQARSAKDAGTLNLVAKRMALDARMAFDRKAGGRGGELNIASSRIQLGGQLPTDQVGNTLLLDVGQLNATGVSSLLVGGLRGANAADGSRLLNVLAGQVKLDNSAGEALALQDVILAASDQVSLAQGSVVSAVASSEAATAITVEGDGALVRVSADADVTSQRRSTLDKPIERVTGTVSLGEQVTLRGASVVVEATRETTVADSADLQANTLTVGAGSVVVGSSVAANAATEGQASPLVVGSQLAQRLASANKATLRAYGGIEFLGQATLGGSSQSQLTLDTAQLTLSHAKASADGQQAEPAQVLVQAGSLTVLNTSGLAGESNTGSGTLILNATGSQGQDGHIQLADGLVHVSGAGSTSLNAAGSVVLSSRKEVIANVATGEDLTSKAVVSGIRTGGDLGVSAQSVTTGHGAVGLLASSAGQVSLTKAAPLAAGTPSVATPGAGGVLSVAGEAVSHSGVLDLPAGAVSLQARTGNVVLADGSVTRVDGQAWTVDGVTTASSAGSIKAVSLQGDVDVQAGARLSASAPQGVATAGAGSVVLLAPKGQVKLDGDVRLLSDGSQAGGAIKLDGRVLPSVAGVLARLDASTQAALAESGAGVSRRNAAGRFALQQRGEQDVRVEVGSTLRAQQIELVADAGAIHILGTLDASGTQAGSVYLAASGDIQVGDNAQPADTAGARVLAYATGQDENGGQIKLASQAGTVSLHAPATLDLSAGNGGTGGTLVLRAAETATQYTDADGNLVDAERGGVAIQPVQATIVGAAKVVVQGVTEREVSALDAAELQTVKKSHADFLKASAAANTLAHVLNGRLDASVSSVLQPAQVLYSTGSLDLSQAWNLNTFERQQTGTQYRVVQLDSTPMDLSIRAADALNIQASLSSGFAGTALNGALQTSAAANTTLKNANAVVPAGLILGNGLGANLTLVAGADLGSADVLATNLEKVDVGHLTIGDGAGNKVVLRSTTGDIKLAAAGDVVLANTAAAVYTTGKLAAASAIASAQGFGTGLSGPSRNHANVLEYKIGTSSAINRQAPFMVDGGSIDVRAGGGISAALDESSPAADIATWAFNKGASTNRSAAWWSRYDLFNLGFATFGGGGIQAQAGGDIRNLGFVTATSGFKDAAGVVHRFGGGDITLNAGGAIDGALVRVGGNTAQVVAGQGIGSTAERGGLQLQYEDTRITVQARQGMEIDRITETGMFTASGIGNSSNENATPALMGLGAQATLALQAVAGDVVVDDVSAPGVDTTRESMGLLPSHTSVWAPQGSISLTLAQQMPTQAAGANLQVLARGDVHIGGLSVLAYNPFGNDPYWAGVASGFNAPLTSQIGLESASYRDPVRLVGQTGDVSVTGLVENPLRVVAGRDVYIDSLTLQHQGEQELSLIQAGRDLNLTGNALVGLTVGGPGDALFMAGRDVNNALAGGIQAVGSRENALLPDGSASLTVLAGVNHLGADYQQAVARYFHVLGGAGVADWPADLYAQIASVRAGQAVSALDSEQAQAFAAQDFVTQLAQARALVGDAAYEQAVLSYMQGQRANPALSLPEALQGLSSLPEREQDVLVGSVLAGTWSQTLGQAAQLAAVQAMSAQGGQARMQALQAFVAQRTGAATVESALDALSRFVDDGQVSAEERVLFVNSVLKDELLAAGRAAKDLTSTTAKQDAYHQGYKALAAVFPGSKDTSSLLMGSSSIKSLQDSSLTIIAPHGGMNVGRLTGSASAVAAASLGIVTTSGGDISGVVRDSIEVNQSRIFSVQEGDILLWASQGDIDAGKGAKTVVGAPAPVYQIKAGKLVVDTTGSFSGSGIAVLNADSQLDLYAPQGAIDAGEAGIKSAGTLNLGATVIIGGNDIQMAGGATLAPAPVVGNGAANIGSLGQSATAAGTESPEEKRDIRQSKRRLLLDLLGFGSDDKEDDDKDKNKGEGPQVKP